MILNFTWKQKTGLYQNGETLHLNRIVLGYCDWNGSRTRDSDENNRYIGGISLPSLKIDRFYNNDPEALKQIIERTVINWFAEALHEVKP